MESQPGFSQAVDLQQNGRLAEAEVVYRRLLSGDPDHPGALCGLGVICGQKGDLAGAAQLLGQAVTLCPANAGYRNNLGIVLQQQGALAQAEQQFRAAIALSPTMVEAHVNLGNTLLLAGRTDECVIAYRNALSLRPGHSMTHLRIGRALLIQGHAAQAVPSLAEAVKLNPGFAAAHEALADALDRIQDYAGAEQHYRIVTSLQAGRAEIWCKLGRTLISQERTAEAQLPLERALELDAGLAEAHYNLASVMLAQCRTGDARACFRKALLLNPEFLEARWGCAMAEFPLVHADNEEPDQSYARFSAALDELDTWFDSNRSAEGYRLVGTSQPFPLAYQERRNRDLLARYGNLCTRLMQSWQASQGCYPRLPDKRERMRVAIVSAHIVSHSVWSAILKGWFQHLDQTRFDLEVFHLQSSEDQETLFARQRAAHFEKGNKDLREWVDAILDRQPDILIYPEIGMDSMTAKLASLRLAPTQVTTWGHPETSGLPTIDYYLSAENFEPADAQDNYTERLITLPNLGCAYERLTTVAEEPDLSGLGITPGLPLLLCAGTPFKYAPQFDVVLTEIVRRLGRCQLLFFLHHWRAPPVMDKLRLRLRQAFNRAGLPFESNVVIIPSLPRSAYYGLMKCADVYLDTIGFSGFNSAMQAVECALPIVTREGRFMRGRFASGILTRMGLRDLVTQSEQAYIDLAVRFAEDTVYREQTRRRIEASRHVLYDDVAPIRSLEKFLLSVKGD